MSTPGGTTGYKLLKGLDDLLNPKPKSPSIAQDVTSLGTAGLVSDVGSAAQLVFVRGAVVGVGFVLGIAGLALIIGSVWGSAPVKATQAATTPVATLKAAAATAAA